MAKLIKAIILDFDGVVIESNDIKTEAFFAVFSRYPEHVATVMAYHHANVSASRYAKFQFFVDEVLGRRGDQQTVESLARQFSEATRSRLANCPMVPGAREFLERYSSLLPLFLASVTPQEELMQILEMRDLSRYFRFIYGCPPWTKPAAVFDALGLAGVRPSEAILIGDSPGDRDAAEATGVEFVARDSGIAFVPPPLLMHKDLFAIGDLLSDRIS